MEIYSILLNILGVLSNIELSITYSVTYNITQYYIENIRDLFNFTQYSMNIE
jgi:hypothetical protein